MEISEVTIKRAKTGLKSGLRNSGSEPGSGLKTGLKSGLGSERETSLKTELKRDLKTGLKAVSADSLDDNSDTVQWPVLSSKTYAGNGVADIIAANNIASLKTGINKSMAGGTAKAGTAKTGTAKISTVKAGSAKGRHAAANVEMSAKTGLVPAGSHAGLRISAESGETYSDKAYAVGSYSSEKLRKQANLVAFRSSAGGSGTTLASCLYALWRKQRGDTVALADMDFYGGGMELILGIESESGVRWQDIHAPLGHLESQSLLNELPEWEGIGILSSNMSEGKTPQWWEIQAALEALSETNKTVIIDVGRGLEVKEPQVFENVIFVDVTEMSVLSLVRQKNRQNLALQKSERNKIRQIDSLRTNRSLTAQSKAVLGIIPWAAKKKGGAPGADEASEYLGQKVLGPVARNKKLCTDVLSGLGIREIPKDYARAFEQLDGLAIARN